MDRLLRYALLASIAVHVAAVAALYPRPWTPQPLPVIVATLQGPVTGLPEIAPVAPEPRAVAAAPTPAVPRPASRRPAVLAVAASVIAQRRSDACSPSLKRLHPPRRRES